MMPPKHFSITLLLNLHGPSYLNPSNLLYVNAQTFIYDLFTTNYFSKLFMTYGTKTINATYIPLNKKILYILNALYASNHALSTALITLPLYYVDTTSVLNVYLNISIHAVTMLRVLCVVLTFSLLPIQYPYKHNKLPIQLYQTIVFKSEDSMRDGSNANANDSTKLHLLFHNTLYHHILLSIPFFIHREIFLF